MVKGLAGAWVTGVLRTAAAATLVVGLAPALPGCTTKVETSFLDPSDLTPYKPKEEEPAVTYDRNMLIEDASFVDSTQATSVVVQEYLERSPYGSRSFLGTYQSSGLRASDALVTASRTYGVNPIALLAFAQVRAGLLSLKVYPEDPARVEYAFQCGCESKGVCDPRLAGFDKQIDCLARQLRESIEAVKLNGATVSGFGPNRTSFTVDGARVTPANGATAAIYQALPREARDKPGGAWLLWNLWQKYASAYQYQPPLEATGEGGGIGDPCKNDAQCALPQPDRICATNYPGGLCTTSCTGDCPDVPGKAKGFCADFRAQGGYCLAVCNPNAPKCRTGYACTRVVRFNSPKETEATCYPQ